MARGPRKSLDDKIREKYEIIEALKTRIKSEQSELDAMLKEKQDKEIAELGGILRDSQFKTFVIHFYSPSCRKVYTSLDNLLHHYRCNEKVRSEHVLILRIPCCLIIVKIKKQRTHHRCSRETCMAHALSDIWAKSLSDKEIFFEYFVIILTKAPHLVILSRCKLTNIVDKLLLSLVPRRTLTMHTEHRAEASPRKPSDQKFFKIRILYISAYETTYIGCPPRNARNAHIKPRLKLLPHSSE